MTVSKTRTTIATAIAAMGIASALPAVSQANPHKPLKAPVAHVKHRHHRHGAPAAARVMGAPTTAAARTIVPDKSTSPLQPSFRLTVPTAATTTKAPVSTITVQRIGVGKTSGPLPIHLPPVVAALQGASAGVPGYDDKACESLAGDYNKAVNEVEQGLITGDEDRTSKYGNLANLMYGQLTDNCMVIY